MKACKGRLKGGKLQRMKRFRISSALSYLLVCNFQYSTHFPTTFNGMEMGHGRESARLIKST